MCLAVTQPVLFTSYKLYDVLLEFPQFAVYAAGMIMVVC